VDHRRDRLFTDDVTEERILEIAGSLGTLVVQPGWSVWESLVRESREAALEDLVIAPPEKILFWQGYSAALRHVIEAPDQLLEMAKGIQEEQQERTGDISDRVRVGPYDSADPSV
jgi:hypothetical protein